MADPLSMIKIPFQHFPFIAQLTTSATGWVHLLHPCIASACADGSLFTVLNAEGIAAGWQLESLGPIGDISYLPCVARPLNSPLQVGS